MILRARYVVASGCEPMENGAVRMEGGQIAEVGRADALTRKTGDQLTDFGDAVILPGLVNAHSHLELSFLHETIAPSVGFVPWLQAIAARMAADSPARETVELAVKEGVRKSLAFGVTLIADITRFPQWTRGVLAGSPLRAVSFGEVIAVGNKRGLLRDRIRVAVDEPLPGPELPAGSTKLFVGISPHSPYSVELDGLRECARWAERHNLPVCIHLAESQEEVEYVRTGRGPLADLLRDLGVWDDQTPVLGGTPIEAATRTGLLTPRTIVAHANYVSDSDIVLLAKSGAGVAYCPRTHAAFGHPPHRFCDMLQAGINVCLGTDSLASNPSLSVLDELRFLRCLYPNLDAIELLQMGSVRGATALRLNNATGSIAVGKAADFTVIPLATAAAGWEDILDSRKEPMFVYVAGERLSCESSKQG